MAKVSAESRELNILLKELVSTEAYQTIMQTIQELKVKDVTFYPCSSEFWSDGHNWRVISLGDAKKLYIYYYSPESYSFLG